MKDRLSAELRRLRSLNVRRVEWTLENCQRLIPMSSVGMSGPVMTDLGCETLVISSAWNTKCRSVRNTCLVISFSKSGMIYGICVPAAGVPPAKRENAKRRKRENARIEHVPSSSLNTNDITALCMWKVCTEAVHERKFYQQLRRHLLLDSCCLSGSVAAGFGFAKVRIRPFQSSCILWCVCWHGQKSWKTKNKETKKRTKEWWRVEAVHLGQRCNKRNKKEWWYQ